MADDDTPGRPWQAMAIGALAGFAVAEALLPSVPVFVWVAAAVVGTGLGIVADRQLRRAQAATVILLRLAGCLGITFGGGALTFLVLYELYNFNGSRPDMTPFIALMAAAVIAVGGAGSALTYQRARTRLRANGETEADPGSEA